MSQPPETPREPVTETLHGHAVEDPYRWLEADGDDERVAEWLAAQDEYTDSHLHTDTREALRPRIEPLAAVASYHPVVVREERFFQRVEAASEDHAALYTGDLVDLRAGAVDYDDRDPLVDPNEWDGARSLVWYVPSPDGERIAYGLTEGGDEQYDVVVVDTDGAELDRLDDVGRCGPQSFAWTPDGDGFYHMATGSAADGGQLEKTVHYHELGADASTLLATETDPHVWPGLATDRETGTLCCLRSEMSGGTEVYVLPDDPGAYETGDAIADVFRPVLVDSEAEFVPTFHDGTVLFETDFDAPNRRVLACSLDAVRAGDLAPDDLTEVVPERDAPLEGFAVAGDRLVVHHHHEAHSQVRHYPLVDAVETGVADAAGQSLSLPEYSTVGALSGNRDVAEVFSVVQSFDHPPTVRHTDLTAAGDEATTDLAGVDVAVPDDLVVRQEWVDSTDGARVPLFVCHRGGIDRDGDNPAILYGYGGFRISVTPSFGRFRGPFLDDGGVFAFVCARGGYEFGESWHEAGMLAEKQHTFDDFLAAAVHLQETGYTAPERLAVMGGSNGGLSVGAVLTQRPDLFGAALSAVPLLDMLRFHRFLLGESWTTEYGHPEDEAAFGYLSEYSPYHNVEARPYPPTLFTTAAGDTRVHPTHARKMAARMQAEAEGGPFLLRERTDTGHGVGKPTSMVVEEQLDTWTFLYDALDVEP
ncbi:prolyl oligopeptidase family serine peptidase [Halomarina rubra]|uniref:prolyl oligopeptidase n=1 Tax=Halomarina rubra TaxID=2071873 RepID=A0ABD6AW93_9EURY|nr:prolyl oligopeptidase family serine peptidase [Halomarina rubra]